MNQANGPAVMFCPACRRYCAPRNGRHATFCASCGGQARVPVRVQLDVDLTKRQYMLDELRAWAGAGAIDGETLARLAGPYEVELHLIAYELARTAADDAIDAIDAPRLPPPLCHATTPADGAFCVDCGALIAPVQGELWVAPMAAGLVASMAAPPGPDARAEAAAIIEAAPAPEPERPRRARRLLRELRPVFYENLILFLGAFLVFAGSIYFAVYFWDRLGAFGPLVAGGLLAIYGLGFAGTGYLLQRRYHADLSARVLYGVATAMLPVASTLLGEPLRAAGVGTRVLAGGAVAALCAIAYPAIVTAASLFQREIGAPFARAFVALLAAIGLAPVLGAIGSHALAVAYIYAATLPVLAMYRRIRGVGLVLERATIVYIVGGSAYVIAAEAVRVAITMAPSIAAAELAPLGVLLATAAIDLDVAWRQRGHATRSALGVVGVLAHATAIAAIVVAAGDPAWRVVTTLSAGLVFAVTALRHRRAAALYLAIATTAAGLWLIAWLPAFAPPRGVAFGGLLVLPVAAGLSRLAARWRRRGAHDYAAPCEHGALAVTLLAALATVLPVLGAEWTIGSRTVAPALTVLPASSAVLALAWRWGRRRPYLAGAALAAAATVLVGAHAAGADLIELALIAAALTIALARRHAALLDAALVLLVATAGLLVAGGAGPWLTSGAITGAVGFVAFAAAAIAIAAQRPYRALGVVAVVSFGLAGAAALWPVVPVSLLAIVLALALLAVDRTLAGAAIGQARPLRDAYPIALGLVGVQAIVIAANADSLATISPTAAALIALALLWIAARHASPWPTYGAIACLVGAGYAAPAALHLALPPRAVAEGVGLVIIALALAARGLAKLRPWRHSFLDVPLHVAAVVAPINLARALSLVAAWETGAAPASQVSLRPLASPIALAVLATITHGSRVHAYLAAAASVLALPVIIVVLGVDDTAIATTLAGAAVGSWLVATALARYPGFARPVVRGALPLPLFGHWRLPSAATWRALWTPPVTQLGLVAALVALYLALVWSALSWPTGTATSAVAYALLAAYALARISPTRRGAIAIHAACATIALVAGETAHLVGAEPSGGGLVMLGAAYLIASEVLAKRRGARTVLGWAIAFLLVPATALADLRDPATPLAAALVGVALVRAAQRSPARGLRGTAATAITLATGLAVLWLLVRADAVDDAPAVLAATAAVAAWAHWLARGWLPAPFGLASLWAGVAGGLAVFACADTAPLALPAIAALVLATAWFAFAAIRTGAPRHGYAAEAMLFALYLALRLTALAELTTTTDLLVAIAAAFALHFAAALLQRVELTALARPARFAARALPVVAAACALALAADGDHPLSTVQHAVLAETIGVLYLLDFRRGGPRVLGAVALACGNLGLAVLWIATDRDDPLYYTVPLGISISLLARLYQAHMSRTARRGLRTTGALLVYFSTYYQVVQFDHGLYPLLLGGFALAGIALGFWLQLRELFVLSIGFLVLDVISNLAYYGVHRPVLGWTLLTLAGLCLTASGVVFQLRRAQVRGLVSDVRANLARWD